MGQPVERTGWSSDDDDDESDAEPSGKRQSCESPGGGAEQEWLVGWMKRAGIRASQPLRRGLLRLFPGGVVKNLTEIVEYRPV